MTEPSAASYPSQGEEVAAAKLLLTKLGISVADLLKESAAADAPTFAEYIPAVARAVSPGTRRAYQPYWRFLADCWPTRRITDPTPTEFEELAEQVKANAIIRRNSRGGRSAVEHFVAAARCLYRHAENDRLIHRAENRAIEVRKPRRLASQRRALRVTELSLINRTAATTGNDPELDTLLLRLHTETACRRGGALALRPKDVDPDLCLVHLREKGGTSRWQPVSPTLACALIAHDETRPAENAEATLLRYRNGRPITHRRYDHLWLRIGHELPWVARQGISTHWLRHTTLTWVERNFGYATAQAFAGHTTPSAASHSSTTATYVKASIHDVATALAALTGEPHPLAEDIGSTATTSGDGMVWL
ncbi:site-specific integrase [Amycolatopsis sp. NPDC047767]|uniref:tyrosine-type recombinase/integrase n=1 Tax=Amycolatopsis sp. NPDC047767 TaxID=3156765 RepID=UPI003453CA37